MIFLLCLALSFIFSSQSLQTSTRSLNDDVQVRAESTLSGVFSIRATSRNGENIALENPISYSGGSAYRVNWSEIESFSISFEPDVDAENLPAADPEDPVYTLSIGVNYLKGYLSSNNFDIVDRISLENVDGTENSDLAALSNFTYTFDVDDGISGIFGGNNVTASGWGIYQFHIIINDREAFSDFYAVEPTYSVAAAPEIDYTALPPDYDTSHYTFEFYLVNFDDYEYIDPACLVWYVKGIAEDGTIFALCSADLALDNFADCSTAIYDTYDRTGQTFLFNDQGNAGEWQVWCEYRYNNATYSTASNVETVETGDSFDYFMIVYIVIGLAVLAVITIIITSIVRNKKEKVW